ncbi:MAG TPA: RtcB family protein, partial [Verrucomicrobiae bacterium]|nr:RtcB family protein [Verrucomicrobiae bacterium]
MNSKDLLQIGVPAGESQRRATDFISKYILGGGDKARLEEEVRAVVANPTTFIDDPLRGEFARALLHAPPPPRAEPAPWRQWGANLDEQSIEQMRNACQLPIAVAGAL